MWMVHKLQQIAVKVEKTHRGLGRLVAFLLCSTMARKCVLVVGASGTGKSTAMSVIQNFYQPRTLQFDSVTKYSLKQVTTSLNNFSGVITIDDLAAIDTQYSRVNTMKTFAQLVYTHNIHKLSGKERIRIENFHGSAVMAVVPNTLANLVDDAEWDGMSRDKTIRYYHLQRPITPSNAHIKFSVNIGEDFDAVKTKSVKQSYINKLKQIGLSQWSIGRVYEHLSDLLRAAAAIDGRNIVGMDDVVMMRWLLAPLGLEKYVLTREGFESGKQLDVNAIFILTELASYEKLTVQQIAENYKVTERTVQRLLLTVTDYCYITINSKQTVVRPTLLAQQILQECGYA